MIFEMKTFEKYQNLFNNYLPLKESVALHIYKLETPLPSDVLSQVCYKLAHWERSKKWNIFTDKLTQAKSDQKSPLELSAQVSL